MLSVKTNRCFVYRCLRVEFGPLKSIETVLPDGYFRMIPVYGVEDDEKFRLRRSKTVDFLSPSVTRDQRTINAINVNCSTSSVEEARFRFYLLNFYNTDESFFSKNILFL